MPRVQAAGIIGAHSSERQELSVNTSADEGPFSTPESVKVREAWFKAGANLMAGLVFLSTLLVGALVGLAAAILDLGPPSAVSATVLGVWVSMAAAMFYVDVTARRTAGRGGVQVDRF